MANARVAIGKARQNLSDLVNRVSYGRERVVLCRYGRPTAAIVSIVELKRLEHQELLMAQPPPERPPGPGEYGRRGAQKMVDELRALGIDV